MSLIEELSRPHAYPFAVDKIEVRQTHISVVFLTDGFVYKIKKPVDLGFLDFSTLEKRRHYCHEEVRLNRRLAASVYVDVVPVSRTAEGIKVENDENIVEWAVKMKRLPDQATIKEFLRRGDRPEELLIRLAHRLADFHRRAQTSETIADFGRFHIVKRNAIENFVQSQQQVGTTVSVEVFDRAWRRTEEVLEQLKPLIEQRADQRIPRDTHGDLHLSHVYCFPDRPSPDDLVIVDCIEFNERFRFADPVADAAFVVMDLKFHGWRDLAELFARSYFEAATDRDGVQLLPFYTAYRACVRAKVKGIELTEKEIPAADREAISKRTRAYWLLALGELEPPEKKPCLVLVGGLPGSGKSTLARGLAEAGNFKVIRSDVVRKQLAGADESAATEFGQGIYTPEWTEATYQRCLELAGEEIFHGHRVIVDATFGADERRRRFIGSAMEWGVPAIHLLCRNSAETARTRIESRRGDVSDADWSVYREAAVRWQEPGGEVLPFTREIRTDVEPGEVVQQAIGILREFGLQP